jgi:Immunoglobulin I-set domain
MKISLSRSSVFSAVAVLLLLAITLNLRAQYNYITLSLPGAEYTVASGICGTNIVGYYSLTNSATTGFLYNGSSYTTLSVPGTFDTYAYGISGSNIVGYYQDSSGGQYGFLYNGSTYNTLKVQGLQTWAYGVSSTNVVGYTYNYGSDYGFFYDGSIYNTFSAPGAVNTVALGISGTNIVGLYETSNGGTYGFLATPAPVPTVSIQPQIQTVMVGSSAVFDTTTEGTPPLNFQWLFKGTNIPGATNSTLTISNAFPVDQRLYAIVATNLYGSVTSSPAMLTVSPLALAAPQLATGGQFQFSFDTITSVNYTVQYSTSLSSADWIPLLTLEGYGGPITIIDPNAVSSSQRFYRIVLSAQ